MASSKSKGARKSDSQETTEEDKTELCPGFKDVDAFVKVSVRRAEGVANAKQASSGGSGGATWVRLLLRPQTSVRGSFKVRENNCALSLNQMLDITDYKQHARCIATLLQAPGTRGMLKCTHTTQHVRAADKVSQTQCLRNNK